MSNSLRDQLLGLGYKPAPAPDKPMQKPANARPSHEPLAKDRPSTGRPPRDARTDRPRGERNRGTSPRTDAGTPRPPLDRSNPPESVRPGEAASRQAAAPGRGARPVGSNVRARVPEMDLGKAFALRAQTEKQERIAAEQARQDEARLRREARAKLTEFLAGKVLNDAAAEIARHFPYGGKIKRIHVNEEQLRSLNLGELGVLQQDGRYLLVDRATLDAAEAIFAPSIALRVDPHAPAGDDPYADPAYQVPDDLVW